MVSKLLQSSITLNGVPDGRIYHYTTFATFRRIIKNGFFLLSQYQNLTDNTELVWAYNYYLETIKRLFPQPIKLDMLPNDYFVFCTCLRNNNAFLWDHYGSGAEGKRDGIAIGIQAHAFYDHYSIRNRNIDMAPMDYDTERYRQVCAASIAGLPTIATEVIGQFDLSTDSYQERRKYLMRVPGYAQYMEKREEAVELMTLQKGANFSKEEEMRIIHWQEVNEPLAETILDKKRRRILPWKVDAGHFLSEIILTKNCPWDEKRISRFLRSNGIDSDIQTINEIV